MDYLTEKGMRNSLGRGHAKALGQGHRGHFGGIVRACMARFPQGTTNREGELVEEAKLQKAQGVTSCYSHGLEATKCNTCGGTGW